MKKHPIDINQFRSRFNGLEDIARTVLEEFAAAAPNLLSAVEDAIQERSLTKLEISAHTLAGVVSNLHADGAREAARRLEAMAKHGNLSQAAEAYQTLETEIKHVLDRIPELLTERKIA